MTKIIISGGGTGGHVFPAISIANALRKIEPGVELLFIGAQGRMEMEKVPAAGYKIEGLNISGLQRRITWKNLTFPFKVLSSLARAGQIIKQFAPDAVIGVGGYASGPTLRVATNRKIPTLIQEQNSYPGITNRILGKKVSKICVAYEGMEMFFPADKLILTGNPVRQDIILSPGKIEEGLKYFNLQRNKKTVLVLGGSLGAGTINSSIGNCLDQHITDHGIQLIWQTGKYYHSAVSSNERFVSNPAVRIYPFIEKMDLAYNVADLIISRAGAIAVSELCIIGKPVILIPSPNVAEDHQTKNARSLVNRNAAIMLLDNEAEHKLFRELLELSGNDQLQKELGGNIRTMAKPDAAERIAMETLEMLKS